MRRAGPAGNLKRLLLGRPSGKRFGRRPGRSVYRCLSWLTRQHRVQHESRDPARGDPGRKHQPHCFRQRIKKLRHGLHADPNSQRKRQNQKFAMTELNPVAKSGYRPWPRIRTRERSPRRAQVRVITRSNAQSTGQAPVRRGCRQPRVQLSGRQRLTEPTRDCSLPDQRPLS